MGTRSGLPGLWLQEACSSDGPRCYVRKSFAASALRPPSHGLLPDGRHRNSKAANSWEMSYPSDKEFYPNGLPELSLELHFIQDASTGPLFLPSCPFHWSQTCTWTDVSPSFSWIPPHFLSQMFSIMFLARLISSRHLLLGGSRPVHRLLA